MHQKSRCLANLKVTVFGTIIMYQKKQTKLLTVEMDQYKIIMPFQLQSSPILQDSLVVLGDKQKIEICGKKSVA